MKNKVRFNYGKLIRNAFIDIQPQIGCDLKNGKHIPGKQ